MRAPLKWGVNREIQHKKNLETNYKRPDVVGRIQKRALDLAVKVIEFCWNVVTSNMNVQFISDAVQRGNTFQGDRTMKNRVRVLYSSEKAGI